jgi:hypothetical protein
VFTSEVRLSSPIRNLSGKQGAVGVDPHSLAKKGFELQKPAGLEGVQTLADTIG